MPGLASTLSFASLSVRSPYLDLLERHFLKLDPRSLRPAMKSIILALLPGLEDETSEDFDRTFHLVESFKNAIRPENSKELAERHSSGDTFFWQCFFLASITSHSRRSGALAYLVRCLPKLSPVQAPSTATSVSAQNGDSDLLNDEIADIITSPEPGLLLRCFASGLSDDQLLIQRGFLDLLVTHLPLNSKVVQTKVKPGDLELLLKAAVGVVTRREMSLNRRLWAWLLGPEPTSTEADHTAESPSSPTTPSQHQQTYLASRTSYFEEFGLHPLVQALLSMIKGSSRSSAAERARPYRICLSLMDRWEIGGLIVPEVFLPVIESVQQFKEHASSKAEFTEVLRSASVFFDGIESGLIYGEIIGLLAQAIGSNNLSVQERSSKLSLISFILTNFNVREEEMVTIHAPMSCLATLCMLEDSIERRSADGTLDISTIKVIDQALNIATSLLELVPERAFSQNSVDDVKGKTPSSILNIELLKKIRTFYVNEQGNIEASPPPFRTNEVGRVLLCKTSKFVCDHQPFSESGADLGLRIRILILALIKTPSAYHLDEQQLLTFLHRELSGATSILLFPDYSSMLHLATQLYSVERISSRDLSNLVVPFVQHAWLYLAASEPKYHVEAVRGLWQLQSALSPHNRDIEAALSSIVASQDAYVSIPGELSDKGRTFSVLWSHTLQDSASGSERRGSRTPFLELRGAPRLAGMDYYGVMLTQPLFLILDALLDERTQMFMTVKTWLNSMIGIDR